MGKVEKVLWSFLFLVLLLFIIALIYGDSILFGGLAQISPSEPLEVCNTVRYNGEGKINLVFFSDKETAEEYTSSLLEVEPFKGEDLFNSFYIDTYEPECQLYDSIALLCYSKKLVRKAASCPNDYIIVIESADFEMRSSAYMNVLSINSEHPRSAFYHEMGHVLGLADEYVPVKLVGEVENCVPACEDFGEGSGCFEGCSREDYFRSVENGVMRDFLSTDYGEFNELLIEKRMAGSSSKITGNVIATGRNCESEEYYSIEAIYDSQGGDVDVIEKRIEVGCVGSNGYGDFDYGLFDVDGNRIIGESFNPNLIFTDAPSDEGIVGEVLESSEPFVLKIPVVRDVAKLEIVNEDIITKISLIDIGEGSGSGDEAIEIEPEEEKIIEDERVVLEEDND